MCNEPVPGSHLLSAKTHRMQQRQRRNNYQIFNLSSLRTALVQKWLKMTKEGHIRPIFPWLVRIQLIKQKIKVKLIHCMNSANGKKLLKLAQYFYNSNSVKALSSADYRMAPESAPDSQVKLQSRLHLVLQHRHTHSHKVNYKNLLKSFIWYEW